jgi:hypothetical protein
MQAGGRSVMTEVISRLSKFCERALKLCTWQQKRIQWCSRKGGGVSNVVASLDGSV